MKPSPEVVSLAEELHSRLNALAAPRTAAVRAVCREFSRQLAGIPPQTVLQLALHLLDGNSDLLRFVSCEIVSRHKLAFAQLTAEDLLQLGQGLNSWSSVDSFAMYLSGPAWKRVALSDKAIAAWARSEDRWWRRAALVSTVALSRRGNPGDVSRVTKICTLLLSDRDDMVVKALSWALRELAKKHPQDARAFLARHGHAVASRVIREVNNKLATGLKTPHPGTRPSANKA